MHADTLKARLRPWMRKAPWMKTAMDRIRSLRFALHTPKRAYEEICRRNFRKGAQACTRPGMDLPENGHIRLLLQAVIEKYDVQTLLDLPCGDFHWMSQTRMNGCTYIGGDMVPDVVQFNTDRYASPSCMFRRIDILKDRLPKAELLLCRDLFVHLSTGHIRRALANIRRSDIRFLLMTHYCRAASYEDIETGDWRPINFRLPPWGFPEPLELLSERVNGAGAGQGAQALGKSLALWRVCDLRG
jgi:hypothetical protein